MDIKLASCVLLRFISVRKNSRVSSPKCGACAGIRVGATYVEERAVIGIEGAYIDADVTEDVLAVA